MFTGSVAWYNRFYEAKKDYEQETKILLDLVDRSHPGAETLLDVACGTGGHLEHLVGRFRCTGVDASTEMAEIAGARLPQAQFSVGDMRSFDLSRQFDIVTCLYGSISYMTTTGALEDAFRSMARHVVPGGLLIIEPWVTPEEWRDQERPDVDQHHDGDHTFIRVISSRLDGDLAHLQIHYAVAGGGEVETADEHHVLRLFTRDEYLAAARSAAPGPEWIEGGLVGRGLITAVVGG